MALTKPVLLARPHPIVVSQMVPILEQCGYSAVKLESMIDLPRQSQGVKGAVISLALSSSIDVSPEEVYAKLRRHTSNLPVVFAALLDLAKARNKLEQIAQSAGLQATILGVDKSSNNSSELGKSTTFLYVNKEDLSSPEYKALAARLIQRHFG